MQDYGFRLYNPAIGKFLSVDPIGSKFPMLSFYQFASNSPIRAIDLDGLEGKVAISGTGRNEKNLADKTSPDNYQFRKEAELAKNNGLINDIIPNSIDQPIISGYEVVTQLENYSKINNGIEFLMILSHGSQGRLLINNGMDSKPSAFTTSERDKNITMGETKIQYEKISLLKLAKNENIKFTNNALVVFAGCNTGCRLSDLGYQNMDDIGSVAEFFTGHSGVASIGAMGYTFPVGDVRKVQDDKQTAFKEGYYLFQKVDTKTVKKTYLGDSLTKEVVEKAKETIKNK